VGGWISDDTPDEQAGREGANTAALMRYVGELARAVAHGAQPFEVSASLLCELHAIALEGFDDDAPGRFRDGGADILGSRHVPPAHDQLEALLASMAAELDAHDDWTPEDAAAFVLWRVNWIHPFRDGNGRVARAVAYLALVVGYGEQLPGERTVLEHLSRYRKRYYDALDAADVAWSAGELDVSELRDLLREGLEAQLGG